MYQKSFFIVLLSLMLVAMANTGFQFASTVPWLSGNPSAYDPGVTIEDAVSTSKTPLLVEFYTDACQTCRKVTPVIADVKKQYTEQLTFVMIDLSNPAHQGIADIFGVEVVPALFVFDAQHMHKQQIPMERLHTKTALVDAIDSSLKQLSEKQTLPAQKRA